MEKTIAAIVTATALAVLLTLGGCSTTDRQAFMRGMVKGMEDHIRYSNTTRCVTKHERIYCYTY